MHRTPTAPDPSLDFTLGDLLQLSAMEGALLRAGADQTGRAILRANVIEGAQLSDWGEAGDCIISSGYAFRGQDELLLTQLRRIRDKGVAVLCLKPTRFRQGLPQAVVKEAQALGIALVELPITAIFSNIVQESMEALFQRETRSFQVIQDKMERLLGAFLRSDDPEQTLLAVEEVIANPVMIFDEENELLVSPQSRSLLLEPLQDDIIRQLYKRTNRHTLTIRREGKSEQVPVHFLNIGGPTGIRIIIP